MPSRPLPRLPRSLTGTLVLAVALAAAPHAGAQQIERSPLGSTVERRIARDAAAAGGAAGMDALVAADSARHYRHAAVSRRRLGGAAAGVGLALLAGTYVSYAQAGEMRMAGTAIGSLGLGAALGALGSVLWGQGGVMQARSAHWARVAAGGAAVDPTPPARR